MNWNTKNLERTLNKLLASKDEIILIAFGQHHQRSKLSF
jgi:hypothetical protein